LKIVFDVSKLSKMYFFRIPRRKYSNNKVRQEVRPFTVPGQDVTAILRLFLRKIVSRYQC
ncbi:MAG: hypothetical protein ACE5GU_15310, partial [Candidatus Scalinduaceae bacterium]